jgi:hypothetical protein
MEFKSLAASSVAATILIASLAAPVAAGQPPQCVVQRHLLRVALTAADPAVDTAYVARVVEQLWGAEGVDFDWIDEAKIASEDRLDARVVIGPKADYRFNGTIVWITTGDVIDRLAQHMSVEMQLSRDSARHLMFRGHLLERSLGYTVAHRLGHAVLGLSHAATGLMGNAYDSLNGVTALAALDLDAGNRRSLQKRFGIGCIAAR